MHGFTWPLLINLGGLCDKKKKKIKSELFPTCPRKRNGFEVTQGRCFPPLSYCNEDQWISASSLGRCRAALPSSCFFCVGWEAQSAPSFAGNAWYSQSNSCTHAAQLLIQAGTAQVNASFIKADKSSCKKQAEQVTLCCPACSRAATCPPPTPSALPSSAGRKKRHMREREVPLHRG